MHDEDVTTWEDWVVLAILVVVMICWAIIVVWFLVEFAGWLVRWVNGNWDLGGWDS